MPTSPRPIFRFGPFELLTGPSTLYREGQLVGITPKALATLTVLVTRHEAAVSKEDLLSTVWSDTAVEESNLSQNIYTLRKLLSPDFPGENVIENLPRFGYRFNLSVSEGFTQEEGSGIVPGVPVPADVGSAYPTADKPTSIPSLQLAADDDIAVDEASKAKTSEAIPQRSAKTIGWILAAVVIVLGALTFWQWNALHLLFDRSPQFELTRFTSNLDEDRVTAVALSPDGKLVAYADADGVVIRSTQEVANHPLPSPHMKVVRQISWFPDQLHLLLSGISDADRPEVWKVSVLREPPILFRSDAKLATVSHSGSSVALTTADGSEIWVMGPNGESSRRVTSADPGLLFSVLLWALHDDGFLVESRPASLLGETHGSTSPPTERMSYQHLRLSDGKVTAAQTKFVMGDACLLSSGDLVYSEVGPEDGVESALLRQVPIDPVTGVLGRAKNFFSLLPTDPHLYSFSCSLAGDRIAAIRIQGPVGVFVAALNAGHSALSDVKRLSLDSDVAYPHGWSRDSRSVLYEAVRTNQRSQIYSQALDRHDPEAIVSMNGAESRPNLSADGQWLLFNYQQAPFGKHTLYRVKPQGGLPVAVPANTGEVDDYRCPISAGQCVTLSRGADKVATISVLDPIQGKGKDLYRTPQAWGVVLDWDISPDGSTLVLDTPMSPVPLHTVALTSGAVSEVPFRSPVPTKAVNWAADGKGFFIASPATSGDDLSYVDLNGTATVIRTTSTNTWAIPSPDGKHLAFIDRSLDSNVWLLQKK